jgi:hypothetical protein
MPLIGGGTMADEGLMHENQRSIQTKHADAPIGGQNALDPTRRSGRGVTDGKRSTEPHYPARPSGE